MNETINSQLNHKTIRRFKDKKISSDIMQTLFDVAIRSASSNGMYSYSIIHVKNKEKKDSIAEVCGQPYASSNSDLVVFVVDMYRNSAIAQEKGVCDAGSDMDSFFQGVSDSLIAAQNMVVAAESLDIGTVYLGSILKDIDKISEILNLPKKTFPIMAIGLGYKDHEPSMKPRLPKKVQIFEDEYKILDNYCQTLMEFDENMDKYIDLRDTTKTVGKFTNQIPAKMKNSLGTKRNLIDYIIKRGFKID